MCDGSLQNDKKTMILHTQSFSFEENLILSNELNKKFNFKTKVISHKVKYSVIKFDSKDSSNLKNLIKPFMHLSLAYKIPPPTLALLRSKGGSDRLILFYSISLFPLLR
jgi:hypothetical protein